MDKNYRREIIALILSTQKIHTQDDLIKALKKKGMEVTQATLSRDMKEIGAFKFTEPGGDIFYKCSEPKALVPAKGMVKSIDISGQMCVIHCKPGFASAVASQLDESFISGIMGSIAGDDTVLVILREEAKKEKIKSAIKDILSYNE